MPQIGAQPVALAATLLLLIVIGIGSIGLLRVTANDVDRVTLAHQWQARAAQASEQLVDKTNGLEVSQQEAIDQIQMLQEELQTVKQLMASEQADKQRLSARVSNLTETVDGLRQSFASAQPDTSSAPDARPDRPRHAMNTPHRRRIKARG